MRHRDALLCAALAAGFAHALAATAQPQAPITNLAAVRLKWWSDYFARSRMITLSDGRKLNLFCEGQGAPTIVLEAGAGSGAWAWAPVQESLAQRHRTCSYDRSGQGLSAPARRESSAGAEADDLVALLERAQLSGPVVLVAHSIGGLIVRLYTLRHPERVAGIVLVDPSTENQFSRRAEISPEATAGVSKLMADARACIASVEAKADKPACAPAPPVSLPPAPYRAAWDQAAPARAASGVREMLAFDTSSSQLGAERRKLPIPMILLTRGKLSTFDGLTSQKDWPAALHQWRELQIGVLSDFQDGELRIVDGTDHLIQAERPEAVIKAVDDMIARVKPGG